MATENKDDDLVMVGDGVDKEEQIIVPTGDDEKGKGEGEGEGEDDEQLADGDKRVGAGEAADDEKTEARRVERKSRRKRQKDARDRDKRELTYLRSRNDLMERQIGDLAKKQDASEVATVDGRIGQLEGAIASATDVYSKAITAKNGEDAAEALQIRDKLRDQVAGLKRYKAEQAVAPQQQEDGSMDPDVAREVRVWADRNKWFDFSRADEDSFAAGAIDDWMARDGWDPRTPGYYEELDKRIKKRLPHIAKDDKLDDHVDDDLDAGDKSSKRRRSTGPKFSVGGKEHVLRSNEVHVTKDRRDAMEQAGVWDDPVLRKKYLKQYATWDREHASEVA